MSLKKIAELAGTSISTVSRVLNTPEHRCNENGLEKRIWRIAEELHYIPNSAARELRMGTVAKAEPFVVDILLTRFDTMDRDPFFLELFHYTEEELMEQKCILGEIVSIPDIMSLKEVKSDISSVPYRSKKYVMQETQMNASAFVDQKENTGLVVFGKCPEELSDILRKRYAYIVGIDRNPTDYKYDEVICNGAVAANTAVEYLISLGHTNIAYIGDCNYESRYTGYYQALFNHKIPLRYNNVHQTGQTEQEGFRVMQDIIKEAVRPTAIFCANDCTALGVLKALGQNRKRGYLPSVISIDDIAESRKTTPMLTTIHIPKKEMVHLAVTLLLDRKKGAHEEFLRLELPCRLMERESCTYHNG
ncbi:MAG: substrate-binding domain-containing protein [Bacteroides sp.]|nr:substrate-binding domain-containing protein [Bacteroides sp.]MCM1550622.1 substrate-binding domain-containing protein [Clostridium sp.]